MMLTADNYWIIERRREKFVSKLLDSQFLVMFV